MYLTKYNDIEVNQQRIESYKCFYPKAINALNNMSYIYNFTNIFNHSVSPFMDDCHLKENYQYVIADSIYDVIIKNI